VWTALAAVLCYESLQYERTKDYRIVHKMCRVSAAGLVLHLIFVTIATFDWVMSREPHFYSTVIGFIIAVGQTLSAMVFVVALRRILADEPDLRDFLLNVPSR